VKTTSVLQWLSCSKLVIKLLITIWVVVKKGQTHVPARLAEASRLILCISPLEMLFQDGFTVVIQ
jgi:hypothetical protein